MLSHFHEFLWKNWNTLSRIFPWKYDPKHGTPPCTPHMKVPPVERATSKTSYSAKLHWYSTRTGILQNQVIPQNRGIPWKSYSDIMHFLYSACIPQSPVGHFKFLLSSKWRHQWIRPIVGWFKFYYNNRNQYYKLPLHTKLKLQTLLHQQYISDFIFSLSSKWWCHQMLLIWQLIQISTSQTKWASWATPTC